jgi:hypothetical protein
MPTTVITPSPAIVATIHRGILPLPDTAFSSLKDKPIPQDKLTRMFTSYSLLVKEVTGKQNSQNED